MPLAGGGGGRGGPPVFKETPLQIQMPSAPREELCKTSPLNIRTQGPMGALRATLLRACLSQKFLERSEECVRAGAKIPHALALL